MTIDLRALRRQRWFGAKGRAVRGAAVLDGASWAWDGREFRLELAEVTYAAGPPETYALVCSGAGEVDALGDPALARSLLHHLRAASRLPTARGGSLVFSHTAVLEAVPAAASEPPRPIGAEQSNSSLRYGEALILKLFRRQQAGIQPELEVARFLTQRTTFRHAPLLAGALEYRAPGGAATSALGLLQTFVPNRGDAWRTTLERLAGVLAGAEPAPAVAPLRRLGETTAELHVALGSARDDPAFAPAPISPADTRAWTTAVDDEISRALGGLRERQIALDEADLRQRASGLEGLVGALAIRHHGDYHLGQLLERHDGAFVVIDFEGEPSKPLSVRREKRSPLRDVAGLLRSLDYARHAALRAGEASHPTRLARAAGWHAAARGAFLGTYLARIRRDCPGLVPASGAALRRALAALELEKALYELQYEIDNRPDWLPIPLAALAAPAER